MLGTDNLLKVQHYTELPDSFVVFICKNDTFEKQLPVSIFQKLRSEITILTLKDNAIKKIFNATAYNKKKGCSNKGIFSVY